MLLLIATASVGPGFSDRGLSNDRKLGFSHVAKQSTSRGIEFSLKHSLSGTRTGLWEWPRLGHCRTSRWSHKRAKLFQYIFSFWAPVFFLPSDKQCQICSSGCVPRGWALGGGSYPVLLNAGKVYELSLSSTPDSSATQTYFVESVFKVCVLRWAMRSRAFYTFSLPPMEMNPNQVSLGHCWRMI